MAYFLRQEKKKKGTYLQMYDSYWDKEKKESRTKSVMAFGYVEELISDELPDPVAHYKDFVAKKNEERAALFAEEARPRAFSKRRPRAGLPLAPRPRRPPPPPCTCAFRAQAPAAHRTAHT